MDRFVDVVITELGHSLEYLEELCTWARPWFRVGQLSSPSFDKDMPHNL